MAIREYECKEHGRFELWLGINEPIPENQDCQKCLEATNGQGCYICPWVPSRLGLFKMEGRTTRG